jgi:glycosyltransferase involved in cell wall biosynthesis
VGPRTLLRRLAGRDRPSPLPVASPAGLLDLLRDGPAALVAGGANRSEAESLSVAIVVPPFRRGSGGHGTIAHLVRGLEARGHACSLWVIDDEQRHQRESDARTAELFRGFFGPVQAPIRKDFGMWTGADVAVATGWQTVPAVLRQPGAAARAYLVQDHEPEFYGTSAERLWAEWTYRQGVHCIAASQWLADVLRAQYGASASSFDLAVDHAVYREGDEHRSGDLVLLYARAVTARRAVPLALLAVEELRRRRPTIEIALFGEARPIATTVAHRDLGVLGGDELARAYRSATVGLSLSLTNPSLIALEMMACGLPCVEAASPAMLASFGRDAPMSLAPPEPLALADALEDLLDDEELRAERSRDGVEWVARRTWAAAAAQVEDGLRRALRLSGT